jgi:dTDP-4-dehydrorhamnose reductase
MILLLGASGYIGQAFDHALRQRKQAFTPLSRKQLDYTKFDLLINFLREKKPTFLINAAGYTGKPNVDACEDAKADTLAGNTLFPEMLAHACHVERIPWGHVSSGCIFSGAKIVENAARASSPSPSGEGRGEGDRGVRIEKDLTKPALRDLPEKDPSAIRGYTETDRPNFTFRDPPCSFYSGTKGLAEEAIAGVGQSYIWRLRIPFDEIDNPRNYLGKLQRYAKVYDNVNSISHRADFANACLDLWERRAPFGAYNITNPGYITSHQVVRMIERILKPARKFEYWKDDAEFYHLAAKTPRSNCVLDVSKLLATGVKIRPVEGAIEHSLRNWKPERG